MEVRTKLKEFVEKGMLTEAECNVIIAALADSIRLDIPDFYMLPEMRHCARAVTVENPHTVYGFYRCEIKDTEIGRMQLHYIVDFNGREHLIERESMQYCIGVKDAVGELIYVGDEVEFADRHHTGGYFTNGGVVAYDDQRMRYVIKGKKEQRDSTHSAENETAKFFHRCRIVNNSTNKAPAYMAEVKKSKPESKVLGKDMFGNEIYPGDNVDFFDRHENGERFRNKGIVCLIGEMMKLDVKDKDSFYLYKQITPKFLSGCRKFTIANVDDIERRYANDED